MLYSHSTAVEMCSDVLLVLRCVGCLKMSRSCQGLTRPLTPLTEVLTRPLTPLTEVLTRPLCVRGLD
jgi:hypothetical protein